LGPLFPGALFGIENLVDWLATERLEILDRRAAMIDGFSKIEGWELKGCGAYFAYVSHPFSESSLEVAKALVDQEAILALPGTMFSPTIENGGSGHAERHFRIAFANIDRTGIHSFFSRLSEFSME